MSVVGKFVPFILGLGLIGGFSSYSVNATSLTLNVRTPSSGSVTLDNNDNVVSASSPVIYNLAKNAEDSTSNSPGLQSRTAVNMANSRWVYYSDHHNYINGYKQGHSNYLHHKQRHGSYAKVGGSGDGWRYASAQKWSNSNGASKGTFVAKYDAPYN